MKFDIPFFCQIPLNLHAGIFVTLNPAGENYGGRQNLPANLQALFRPIVMQQPKPQDIAKVMLFAEGFKNADEIGIRLVEVFSVAQKILSPQRHYDWGLRELKTVLLACGKSLRIDMSSNGNGNEFEIAMHALRSNTMSKLTDSDCKRFDMVIMDVFQNESNEMSRDDALRKFVEEAFGALGLQYNDKQILKCLQLYEQLIKRTGVVVLGPPNSGKTTIVSILKQVCILLLFYT